MSDSFRNLQNQVRELRQHGFTNINLNSRRQKLQQVVNQWLPVFNSLSNQERQFLKNADRDALRQTARQMNQLNITDASLRASTQSLRQSVARNIKRLNAITAQASQINNLSRSEIKRQLKRFPNLRPDLRKSVSELRGALARILVDTGETIILPQQPAPLPEEPQELTVLDPSKILEISDRSVTIRYATEPNTGDMEVFFNLINPKVIENLREYVEKWNTIKISIVLRANFKMLNDNATRDFNLWSGKKVNAIGIVNHDEVPDKLDEALRPIRQMSDDLPVFHSGWVINEIFSLDVHIDRFHAMRANGDVKLPECLNNNRGIINPEGVKHNDCGFWSILMGLHYQEIPHHRNRISNYKQFKDEIVLQNKTKKVNFPMKCPTDFDIIEKLNPWLSVSVFIAILEKQNTQKIRKKGDEKLHSDELYLKEINPVRTTKEKRQHHVNLLLYENSDVNHYCLIKDLGQVLGNNSKRKLYVCDNCLQTYTKKENYDFHLVNGCRLNESARPILPKEGEHYLSFTNYHKQLRLPFVIYCDLESDLVEYTEEKKKLFEKDAYFKNTSKKFEQEHIPNSVAGHVVSELPEYNETAVFYNTNEKTCIQQYIEWLVEKEETFCKLVRFTNKEIHMTDEDKHDFQIATTCNICHRKGFPNGNKVRDHDHLTGKYRGATCNGCNLNKKLINRFIIPVVFHNLKGYDSHLIIRDLVKYEKQYQKFKALPQNLEKLITFGLGRLTFIDSMSFLGASLQDLVENLKTKNDKSLFKNLRNHFKDYSDEQIELLTQKGIYPYKFMTGNVHRFRFPFLPDKDDFYNDLTDEPVADSDYEHAQKVWDAFNCKQFKDYHELYLKTDILLLADVFEEFRNLSQREYQLDPCWYLTAPALSWDAFLLDIKSKYTIELFNENQYDMLLFVERSKRGGISMISHRKATANNQYLSDYNPEEEQRYIAYHDMTNLYGYAMMQKLPVGEFQWVDPAVFTEDYLKNIDTENDYGYFLEVDLNYPAEIHDYHNDLPFCPENAQGQWSDYCQSIADELGIKNSKVTKLIPNLYDKKNYVIHFRYLKQALENGLELKQVHKVLQFRQEYVMRDYITKNTNLRKNAKDEFEKNFFKLLNNSVYGKTLENVRGYSNLNVCINEKQFMNQTKKPTYKGRTIISNDLIITDSQKEKIQFNKPVFLGASVLDISKYAMYDYFYNFIKPTYGYNAKLCMMDTDSFLMEIKTNDIYKDIAKNKERFDLSNFKDNPDTAFLKDDTNKKVVGTMKDEADGFPIKEFIGLRPKLYSYVMDDGKNEKKCKGVKKSVVAKQLNHQKYLNSLQGKTKEQLDSTVEFKTITSFKHRVFTETASKSALSPMDDKRYILNDGITTLSHGHYSIKYQTK